MLHVPHVAEALGPLCCALGTSQVAIFVRSGVTEEQLRRDAETKFNIIIQGPMQVRQRRSLLYCRAVGGPCGGGEGRGRLSKRLQ